MLSSKEEESTKLFNNIKQINIFKVVYLYCNDPALNKKRV